MWGELNGGVYIVQQSPSESTMHSKSVEFSVPKLRGLYRRCRGS